jgi:hypothetical protein
VPKPLTVLIIQNKSYQEKSNEENTEKHYRLPVHEEEKTQRKNDNGNLCFWAKEKMPSMNPGKSTTPLFLKIIS